MHSLALMKSLLNNIQPFTHTSIVLYANPSRFMVLDTLCSKEGIVFRLGEMFFLNSHYKKSWFFKRFNLTKISTLTKRMFTLTKGMGHERHMVILVDVFDRNDHFDQVLSHTSNQE